jgi:hypothetical protein
MAVSRQALLQRRRCCRLLAATLLVVLAQSASGSARAESVEYRIIVHSGNPATSVERAFVAELFLKKVTRWSDGETAKPVDLRPDSGVRKRFSEGVLKRSVGAVRSYWQQRIFSGRDVPPPELESEDAVVAYVARYPGAIGYVSASAKLAGVRELGLR